MYGLAYIGPSQEPVEKLLEKLANTTGPIGVDTETVSLKDRSCIGIGVAVSEQEAFYFRVLPEPSPYLSYLVRLLTKLSAVRVFHNAIFDLRVISGTLEDLSHLPFADTSIMAQVQALQAQLAGCSETYLSRTIQTISDILPARKTMLDLEFPVVARKCMRDCMATLGLYYKFNGSEWETDSGHVWSYKPNSAAGYDMDEPTSYYVTPEMKDCYRVDIRLIPLLLRMSKRGIALRQDRVKYWYEKLSQEALYYKDICEREGFNPGSPQQVGMTLAARGNLLKFTKSGRQLQADEEALSVCKDPLASIVLEYRWRQKFLGTYLKPYLDKDRFYTNFRIDVATSRLASYDRNIQNIPATKKRPDYPIREIFMPDSGMWTDADASELEMRIFAYATEDPVLLQAYKEGQSIHTLTQLALWPNSDPKDKAARLTAKTFNFGGVLYDANPQTIERNTGIPASICAEYKARWYERYPRTLPWMNEQKRLGLERGYQQTMFGRKMRLPRLGEATIGHIGKCSINYVPQGTASEIIKRAMLRTQSLDHVAQVHDEMLIDGDVDLPDDIANIHPDMYLPFEVAKGERWL